MRAPRKVTLAPMLMPPRSLKFDMLFLAFVTWGFCPVISASWSV